MNVCDFLCFLVSLFITWHAKANHYTKIIDVSDWEANDISIRPSFHYLNNIGKLSSKYHYVKYYTDTKQRAWKMLNLSRVHRYALIPNRSVRPYMNNPVIFMDVLIMK